MYVPIEYKAAIVKNPNDADMLLGTGEGNAGLLTVAVPKDVEKTHPYLHADVKKRLMERFDSSVFPTGTFQAYDAKCITIVNHFLDSNKYVHKQKKPVVWRYTELYINYIIDRIEKDNQYLFKMRKKYSQLNKK